MPPMKQTMHMVEAQPTTVRPRMLATIAHNTPMKLSTFLLLSTVARLPSVVTSTIGGNALGTGKLTFALIVFGATALISALGILIYRRICKRSEARQKEEQA